MNANFTNNKVSSQKRIIILLVFVFFISVLIICALMYRVFSDNLSDSLKSRASEVIDIIDYMVQASGESPELTKGINTLAANRDIRLIIIKIDDPPVVIASNKAALIGLPIDDLFSNLDESNSFKFDSNADKFTAISPIWIENKFNNGHFTKAHVVVVFDTYMTRTLLQKQILNTSFFLILTTLFVIGLVYYLTNVYIFKPLEVINSSLKNNESSQDFSPIPLTHNDEIGNVANTLNHVFTELYSSKKMLREHTERYELALQGIEVGLFDWDIEHDTMYCSSSLKDLLGINLEKITPTMKWFDDLVHEDDKELANSALVSHLKHNTKYDIEGRLRHTNGNYVWIRARGQTVRDASGKAIRMVGYYVDISKRKRHEVFMHSFYMLLSDLNLSLDRKLNCLLKETCNYLNLACGIISKIEDDKYYTIYCHAPEEYNIRKNDVLKLSDTLCKYTIKNDEIFCIADIEKSEFSHHKSHTKFCIRSYISFPLYIHGRIYGTVNLFDKRAKIHAFEEREKSFVRLITQAIANEMMRSQYIDFLHESEDKLEAAIDELTNTNSELENFTYVASHDLQEPLRMIKNFTGILENKYADQLDNDAKKYFEICSSSAEQMRILINDLLEYAHASGRENEKIEDLSLNEILEHVFVNLKKQISETKAKIIFDDLPSVEANKASMISLLQNLISNAIKFQNKGNRPIIKIKSTFQENKWIISVRDNGIGIPDQYQSKIFEPFKRLHSKKEYMGTGIGLAVCKKIVMRMNGTLWIESDQKTGSTFYFTIPKIMSQTGKAA